MPEIASLSDWLRSSQGPEPIGLSKTEWFTRLKSDPVIQSLTDDECEAYLHRWPLWARPNQLTPPGDWFVWLVLAGRGWGKTRAGAEHAIVEARRLPGSHGAL